MADLDDSSLPPEPELYDPEWNSAAFESSAQFPFILFEPDDLDDAPTQQSADGHDLQSFGAPLLQEQTSMCFSADDTPTKPKAGPHGGLSSAASACTAAPSHLPPAETALTMPVYQDEPPISQSSCPAEPTPSKRNRSRRNSSAALAGRSMSEQPHPFAMHAKRPGRTAELLYNASLHGITMPHLRATMPNLGNMAVSTPPKPPQEPTNGVAWKPCATQVTQVQLEGKQDVPGPRCYRGGQQSFPVLPLRHSESHGPPAKPAGGGLWPFEPQARLKLRKQLKAQGRKLVRQAMWIADQLSCLQE